MYCASSHEHTSHVTLCALKQSMTESCLPVNPSFAAERAPANGCYDRSMAA